LFYSFANVFFIFTYNRLLTFYWGYIRLLFLRTSGPIKHTFRCGMKILGTKNLAQLWHWRHEEFLTHFLYYFSWFTFSSAWRARFYTCFKADERFLFVYISSYLLFDSDFKLSKSTYIYIWSFRTCFHRLNALEQSIDVHSLAITPVLLPFSIIISVHLLFTHCVFADISSILSGFQTKF
jgi:hypothetical protein